MRNYAMFAPENFGKPIYEKLSVILRRNTTKDDFANVAASTGISFSTIRDVVYRTNSLTYSNSKAIRELIKVAFDNSLARQLQSETDKGFLNRLL
jgi:cyanate lyase